MNKDSVKKMVLLRKCGFVGQGCYIDRSIAGR